MCFSNFFISSSEYLRYFYQERQIDKPLIIFIGGYGSDIEGTKVSYLRNVCSEYKLSFLCFEYRGHGKSSGKLLDFTISDWLNDTENIIQKFKNEKQSKIIISSSMGAWISFLYATKHNINDNIFALICIAPALDFTNDIMLAKNQGRLLNFTENRNTLSYSYNEHHRVSFSKKLLLDGNKNNLLLEKNLININKKIRILHGMNDYVVNYKKSLHIAELIKSKDVEVFLFKNGDHRLNDNKYLSHLKNTLLELVNSNTKNKELK